MSRSNTSVYRTSINISPVTFSGNLSLPAAVIPAAAKAPSALKLNKTPAVWPVLAGPAGFSLTTDPRQFSENITLPVLIPAAAKAAAAQRSSPFFVFILPPKDLQAYRAAHPLLNKDQVILAAANSSEPCQLEDCLKAKEVPVEVVGRGRGEAWLTLVRANTTRTNNVTMHVSGGSLLAVCRPLSGPPAGRAAAAAGTRQAEADLQVPVLLKISNTAEPLLDSDTRMKNYAATF
jgi:hypothetical protein